MTNIISGKEESKIVEEWDSIAAIREYQISSGLDHSAIEVLAPAILKEISKTSGLIDIGCGTGWLTAQAHLLHQNCLGIDPSKKSIEIANEKYGSASLKFFVSSIEKLSLNGMKFDTAISNMVASNVLDLNSFIKSSRQILEPNGTFIMTVPHPCFWPQYWGYVNDKEFSYSETCTVEGNFKIQNGITSHITTHFHHSLENYFNILTSQSFIVEKLVELKGRGFKLPRFLLIRAKAI